MLCGRRRSSRLRASSSLAGAARLANRSCNLRMNVAVANVPRATVGSPRSSRQSVSRLTKRRAAISLVEMPRLRRASARSRHNLRSAWVAGNGIEPVFEPVLTCHYCPVLPTLSRIKSGMSDVIQFWPLHSNQTGNRTAGTLWSTNPVRFSTSPRRIVKQIAFGR